MTRLMLSPWGRLMSFSVLFGLGVFGTALHAQDGPPPDAEAVALDSWSGNITSMEMNAEAPGGLRGTANGTTATRSTIDGGGGRPRRAIIAQGYYSPTLRGHFLAQWMYVFVQGRKYEFWGARVLNLDYDSPVRQLGVNAGDVITRLDGIPIHRGMFKTGNQPWQMPELENHFGVTEVRFILRGTNFVRIGTMMLDGTFPDGFENPDPILP